jgi:hypothetical protein
LINSCLKKGGLILRNKLLAPIIILTAIFISFLLTSCGGGDCSDENANKQQFCYDSAQLIVTGGNLAGVSLLPSNKVNCDSANALADIYLYSAIGDAGKNASLLTDSLTSVNILPSCKLRGWDWDKLDEKDVVNGGEMIKFVLCGRRSGAVGSKVMSVDLYSVPNKLLSGGPDCSASLSGTGYDTVYYEAKVISYECYPIGNSPPQYWLDDPQDYTGSLTRLEGEPDVCEPGYTYNIDLASWNETRHTDGRGDFSDFKYRGGYYSVALKESTSLCAATKIWSDDCNKNFIWNFQSLCDNDFVCSPEDKAIGYCNDCKACELRAPSYSQSGYASNKDNMKACQGDFNYPADYSRQRECKWCPVPYAVQPTVDYNISAVGANGQAYPYLLPKGSYSTSSDESARSGCMDVTKEDPFNCGLCGWKAEIDDSSVLQAGAELTSNICTTSSELSIVDKGRTPFCMNDSSVVGLFNCVAPAVARAKPESSAWYSSYHPNPSFYYNVSEEPYGGYSSKANACPTCKASSGVNFSGMNVSNATKAVYPKSSFDTIPEACAKIAGSYDDVYFDTLGCCGNTGTDFEKLRFPTAQTCNLTSLCDGTKWHDSSIPEEKGEVFYIPRSAGFVNPIMNPGDGEALIMCVDRTKFDSYVSMRLGKRGDESAGCVPNITGLIDADFMNVTCGNLTKDLSQRNHCRFTISNDTTNESLPDYSCPSNYFNAGNNWIPKLGVTCSQDNLVDNRKGALRFAGIGYLVCNPLEKLFSDILDTWGFGYLAPNVGRVFPFDVGPFASIAARCPGGIVNPLLDNDANKLNKVFAVPCPGLMQLNISGPSYLGPFGSSDARDVVACLPRYIPVPPPISVKPAPLFDGFYNGLNYVSDVSGAEWNKSVWNLGFIEGYNYICSTRGSNTTATAGTSNAYFAVCCGTTIDCPGIPGSLTAGASTSFKVGLYIKTNTTGKDPANTGTLDEKVNVTRNYVLYCNSTSGWNPDLDNDSIGCGSAGFTFTGRYCCSEYDDNNVVIRPFDNHELIESYHDPQGKGGCLLSSYMPNDDYARANGTTFQGVKVMDGSFVGCGVNFENDDMTVQKDRQFPAPVRSVGAYSVFNDSAGRIIGTSPQGNTDLSIAPWGNETSPVIMMVNGTLWVGSVSLNPKGMRQLILLRPWGEKKSAIIVEMRVLNNISGPSIVYAGSRFMVTGTDEQNYTRNISFSVYSRRINLTNATTEVSYGGALATHLNWPNPGSAGTKFLNGSLLVDYQDTCSQQDFNGDTYTCMETSLWTKINRSHKSVVPDDLMWYFLNKTGKTGMSPLGCCPDNQCWDPNKSACIPPQLSYNEYIFVNQSNKTYKCMNGEWGTIDTFRFTPDGCTQGFCPEIGQCFLNAAGSSSQNGNLSGNPQCIFNGQFFNDNLCVNGSWSSRTRIAANLLLRLVGSSDNFVLSCGPPASVLYRTQTPGTVNSYCVLDLKPGPSGSKRIFAATLNQEVELSDDPANFGKDYMFSIKRSLYEAYPASTLSSSSCSSPSADGFNSVCLNGKDSTGNVPIIMLYSDNATKIVAFSDQAISGLKPGFVETVCGWLPGWLSWLCPTPLPISVSVKNLTFDKLYAVKIGSKELFGIQKDRCECAGCLKTSSFLFRYKSYTKADFLAFLGTNQTIASDAFTIIESSPYVNVSIINPKVDKGILWSSLAFLKG